MAISSSVGISSGIDWHTMVDQMIAIDSQPMNAVQSKIQLSNAQKAAFDRFSGLLSSLRSKNSDLLYQRTLNLRTADISKTTSGQTIASLSVTDASDTGSHTLKITELAATQVYASSEKTSRTDALGLSGSFDLNGKTISVISADGLDDIRDKINDADAGVSAAVLQTGTSSYKLVVSAKEAGFGKISYADGGAGTGAALGLAETVAGKDAAFTIDGVAMTRTTNEIADAIPGVTLRLLAKSSDTVNITVARDTKGIGDGVQAFVDAYNEARKFINDQKLVTQGQAPPILHNDATLRSAERMLLDAARTALTGASGATLYQLHEIGIEIEKGGLLSFKRETFEAKLADDPNGLGRLLGRSTTSTATDLRASTITSAAQAGTYPVVITAAATQGAVANDGTFALYASAGPEKIHFEDAATGKTTDVELTDGMSAADVASAMNTAFKSAGLHLAAAVANDGTLSVQHWAFGSDASFKVSYVDAGVAQVGLAEGTYSGTNVAGTIGGAAATGSGQVLTGTALTAADGIAVRYLGTATGAAGSLTVEDGLSAAMDKALKAISDGKDSLLQNSRTNLETSIQQWTDQVGRMQQRLDVRRKRLEAQFLNMESMIARMNAQSSSLQKSLASL